MPPVPVTIIRSPRERLAKCSLRHLEGRPGFTFIRARGDLRFDATGFTLLALAAPPLSARDAGRPLLILDSSWRHLPRLRRALAGEPIERSLPEGVASAYPRTSKLFQDPAGGLASIEALYLAKLLLGEPDPTLLDGYHWRDEFLAGLQARAYP